GCDCGLRSRFRYDHWLRHGLGGYTHSCCQRHGNQIFDFHDFSSCRRMPACFCLCESRNGSSYWPLVLSSATRLIWAVLLIERMKSNVELGAGMLPDRILLKV